MIQKSVAKGNHLKMKPDFVVICGDLVSKANDKSWADFNRIKAGFKIPCHCAAGNHDVGNKPTVESLQAYREKIGKDYYTVEHKGYTFVIANTQLWKAPLKGESEKHDKWFKGVLAAAKKKVSPVVVVVHYPLFVKTPDEKENYYNIPTAKRMELLKLCKENGVVAFLAGHTHKLVVNEYKGIQLVNGETTSKNFDKRPMGFRWWDVAAKGKMVHRFVALEGMDELVDQLADDQFIVENGEPKAVIVISETPTRMQRVAAEEFRMQIEKISGARLPIRTQSVDGKVKIYIGASAKNPSNSDGLKNGAYRISTGPDWMSLIGDDSDFEPVHPFARNNGDKARAQAEWEKIIEAPYGVPSRNLYKNRLRLPGEIGKPDGAVTDKKETLDIWGLDERGSFNAVCGYPTIGFGAKTISPWPRPWPRQRRPMSAVNPPRFWDAKRRRPTVKNQG